MGVIYYKDIEYAGGDSGGGGGTTVIANPVAPATGDLSKIQIGTGIYSIMAGGGTLENLYHASSASSFITLNKSIVDYDAIVLYGYLIQDGYNFYCSSFNLTSTILNDSNGKIGLGTELFEIWYNVTSNTTLTRVGFRGDWVITDICGVKTADSGGGGSTVIVDGELSTSSAHPVENRVVTNALNDKADKSATYTKLQVDTALELKADASTTYSKVEVNNAISSAVVTELGNLDDVNITSISDGQVLKYDSINSKWINGTGSELIAVDILKSDYDNLSIAEKVNPNKIYFVHDPAIEEVISIKATGYNYILTDIIPNILYDVEVCYIYDEINDSWGNSVLPTLFFAYDTYAYGFNTNSRGIGLQMGATENSQNYVNNISKNIGDEIVFKQESRHVSVYNNTTETYVMSPQSSNGSTQATGNLILFNRSTIVDNTIYSRFKYMKMYDENHAIIHFLVPTKTGVKDKITNKTYDFANSNYIAYLKQDKEESYSIYYKNVNYTKNDMPLSKLTDVNISSPINNQILKYNSTNEKWENSDDVNIEANPQEEASVDLTKLTIGDTTYNISSGGADVQINPILREGIPIATITINGVTTTLYAPQGSNPGWRLGGATKYSKNTKLILTGFTSPVTWESLEIETS